MCTQRWERMKKVEWTKAAGDKHQKDRDHPNLHLPTLSSGSPLPQLFVDQKPLFIPWPGPSCLLGPQSHGPSLLGGNALTGLSPLSFRLERVLTTCHSVSSCVSSISRLMHCRSMNAHRVPGQPEALYLRPGSSFVRSEVDTVWEEIIQIEREN